MRYHLGRLFDGFLPLAMAAHPLARLLAAQLGAGGAQAAPKVRSDGGQRRGIGAGAIRGSRLGLTFFFNDHAPAPFAKRVGSQDGKEDDWLPLWMPRLAAMAAHERRFDGTLLAFHREPMHALFAAKVFLSVILFAQIIFVPAGYARLGEDEVQCEERYGAAKKEFIAGDKLNPLIGGVNAVTRTYLYQGWRIRIGFLDGVAVRETYWKVTGPGRSPLIADYERDAILEGEKGAGAWKPKAATLSLNLSKLLRDRFQQILLGTVLIRSDGQAFTTVESSQLSLNFESLAAVQHDEELRRLNEEKQRASVPAF